MSYFSLYPDYYYPKGGLGVFQGLSDRLIEIGSELKTNTEVIKLDALKKTLTDSKGNQYSYDKLIWCADMKYLYRMISADGFASPIKTKILKEQEKILSSRGAESIFTLFLAVDLPPSYFSEISEGHFFYTPSKEGLGELHLSKLSSILDNWERFNKDDFYNWLKTFCEKNTYEISIPALNDSSTAPGENSLIKPLRL